MLAVPTSTPQPSADERPPVLAHLLAPYRGSLAFALATTRGAVVSSRRVREAAGR